MFKVVRIDRSIVLTPPDIVFGLGFADDKFILSCASSVFARINYYRTLFGNFTFITKDYFLVERFGR